MGADGRTAEGRDALISLQRLLLPPALPAIGCTEAAVHYRVSNDAFRLGGDWYDLIDRPDNRVCVIVGDVVGHGVEQISVMGQLRAASNALGRTLEDPAEILTALDAFAADLPGAEYSSAVVMMLDGTTTARIASAGHPSPIHVRAAGGWDTIEIGRGPLLCIPGERRSAAFEYAIDDVFVLYTDGLVDRRRIDIDERTARIAEHTGTLLEMTCAAITSDLVEQFARDTDDDVVVMALRPRNHRSPDYLLQPQLVPAATFD